MTGIKKIKRDCVKERVKRVIALVADGMGCANARKKVGIGNSKFYEIVDGDPELKDKYAHAREARGETFIDKIETIEEMVASGEIDPAAARVIIDAQKWKASKFYPKMYGDKQQVDMTVQSFDLFTKAVEERAKQYEDQSKDVKRNGT